MKPHHRPAAGVVAALYLLLLAPVTRGWAAWRDTVIDDREAGVNIEVSSPFDQSPPDGFMPCWVTIRNGSGAPRVWTIRCDDLATTADDGGKHVATQTLRVGDGEVARMPLLVQLNATRDVTYHRGHAIHFEGYRVSDATATLPVEKYSSKKKTLVVVGMGEALATPIWASLTKAFEDRGQNLLGTPVTPALLPPDWRGLTGLDCLWLADSEFIGLDAARRAAIRDWVAQGGCLYVSAQNADPGLRTALGLPETGGDEGPVGVGSVHLLAWDGKPLALEVPTDVIERFAASTHEDTSFIYASTWPITQATGNVPLNAPVLIVFIGLFALVVGPVNVFWLAGGARRYRLFWTTPLISVAASLLLVVFIVLSDGFGGSGRRVLLCLLRPDQKGAVVWQEQTSRTGVLLSRGFTVAEDLVLSPVRTAHSTGRSYEQDGRSYTGDWFGSRSVQSQRLEAVVPSRAEIQLLNADAARDGAPPLVTSSIPAALKEIHYLDAAGRHWRGGSLRQGERITLQPDTDKGGLEPLGGSTMLDTYQSAAIARPGNFYAVADDGPFFDTLSSVRWTNQRAVFIGPVTGVR